MKISVEFNITNDDELDDNSFEYALFQNGKKMYYSLRDFQEYLRSLSKLGDLSESENKIIEKFFEILNENYLDLYEIE